MHYTKRPGKISPAYINAKTNAGRVCTLRKRTRALSRTRLRDVRNNNERPNSYGSARVKKAKERTIFRSNGRRVTQRDNRVRA